ncbi:DNA-binding transcriptional regulator [Terriglobus albidus]|uniref:DNA-binding transcriptional regulator n=1 Tax=Terriglobus albidus TaxID=1592106 RepID=A0A5B9E5A4_9BACT|nr:DNA-binding transcriptional regulator [Terriglobus albidus]QEE27432.1 DNA-binding transcriptional regulator [Terriglobus albidus]
MVQRRAGKLSRQGGPDAPLYRVALVIETSTQFGRTLLGGIAQYIRETGPWSVLFTDRAVNDAPPAWLCDARVDGIITRVPSPAIREIVTRKGVPVVDLNEQTADLGIPQISNDHSAVSRMAADHLLKRGYQNFAFIGHSGHSWSDERERTFARILRTKGYRCSTYADSRLQVSELREGVWNTELDALVQWVANLPKPIGIMASTDFRGLQVLTACRVAGIAVPETAAVVGVGADDIACALSDPPLSSVVLDAWRMGYEAAHLLDRMMRGAKIHPGFQKRIPPVEVSVRRSTDGIAISDPLVAKAARFIQDRVTYATQVNDVVRYVGVSGTTLQTRFRKELGKSIHDVILETRLRRVRELLTETDLPLAEVASRCGFRHMEYLTQMMKLRTGWTPGQYRKQHTVVGRKGHS